MPRAKVEARHFSPDTATFIRLLDAHGVRYLIVGGEAVIFHGYARLTGDVDFFFSTDSENLHRLYAALSEFWEGDVPGLSSADDLAPHGLVIQFGQPPNRIDLMNAVDGVTFEDAWAGREEALMVGDRPDVRLPFIGLDALLANKRASGRPKDLDDLSYLTGGPDTPT